ncbi:MAG TPA: AAA family ATPase [bacterium (Candidatus Stahlbacteria)]|nr:AAA family ATPase [Candidatus Stahlbacteria bacterium]
MRRSRNRPRIGRRLIVPDVPLEDRLRLIPLLSPRKIDERLSDLGYRGQESARRGVCLAAYRHLKRLRLLHIEKIPREKLPPRSNLILIGPTGCGKSYIIELLFGKILKLPYVITEMTRYTETGYVGDDVKNILSRLVDAAHDNLPFAGCGVVALDEFDKIAARGSILLFRGGGTTKDVSGFGVQRELLKMLEGAEIELEFIPGLSRRGRLSTRDITFFAIGAFTDLLETWESDERIGFNREIPAGGYHQRVQYHLNKHEAEDLSRFQAYGFIPELIARFDRVVPFQPLGPETLRQILVDRVARYKQEFELEGLELIIADEVYDYIVSESMERKTGARGLDTTIMKCVEEIAFEYFGQDRTGTVTLELDDDGIKPKVALTR